MSRRPTTPSPFANTGATWQQRRSMRQRPELYTLCVIEGCERFAAISLSALLVLYMTEQRGASASDALQLVGTFNALCYLSPIAGGLLSDLFGQWRAMLAGAACMAAAYGALWLTSSPSLQLVLILLIAGHGLFKPSINALLSNLYEREDPRREAAYSWFYFAVNLGSLFAPLVAGVLRIRYGWNAVFFVATCSMALGALAMVVGTRFLCLKDAKPTSGQRVSPAARVVEHAQRRLSIAELVAIGLTVVVSAAAFGTRDGALLLWARDDLQWTLRGHPIPVSWFAALPALLVLVLGPVLAMVDGRATRNGQSAPAPKKILGGLRCISLAFVFLAVAARGLQPGAMTAAVWMIAAYLLLTLGELLVIPLTQALLTRLVPESRVGLASGLWFSALAAGHWVAGMLGACWSRIPHASFFLGMAILVSAAGWVARRCCSSVSPSASASRPPAPSTS